jgi:hypothetical protein
MARADTNLQTAAGPAAFHVEGYPVLFRATITGGALAETLSTLMVDIAAAETSR